MFPLDSDLAPSLIGRLTEPFSFERRQICRANLDVEEKYTDSGFSKDTNQGIVFLRTWSDTCYSTYYYHLTKSWILKFATWHQTDSNSANRDKFSDSMIVSGGQRGDQEVIPWVGCPDVYPKIVNFLKNKRLSEDQEMYQWVKWL